MKERVTGIYKITSPSKRKSVYIGHTTNLFGTSGKRGRWVYYQKLDCEDQLWLYKSLKKYGVENHKFELVHQLPNDVTKAVLLQIEQAFVNAYRDAGYKLLNMVNPEAGYIPHRKKNIKKSTREKLALIWVGKKHKPESIEKIRMALKDIPKSKEHVEKMIAVKKGVFTPKMQAAAKRRKDSGIMKGIPIHTEKSKKKISKTKAENYTPQIGQKYSANAKKQWENAERKQKHVEWNKSREFTAETRVLMAEKKERAHCEKYGWVYEDFKALKKQGYRWCSGCKEILPANKYRAGNGAYCRDCAREKDRKRRYDQKKNRLVYTDDIRKQNYINAWCKKVGITVLYPPLLMLSPIRILS